MSLSIRQTTRSGTPMKCTQSIPVERTFFSATGRYGSFQSSSIPLHGWHFQHATAAKRSMKTTKQVATPERRRNTLLLILGVLALGLIALLIFPQRSPPQIGNDEKVFTAVEALFTAVGAHDQHLLENSATNLDGLHKSRKVARRCFRDTDAISSLKARSGSWQDADLDLRWFMKGQRRTNRSTN